jgi:hypothetical protein
MNSRNHERRESPSKTQRDILRIQMGQAAEHFDGSESVYSYYQNLGKQAFDFLDRIGVDDFKDATLKGLLKSKVSEEEIDGYQGIIDRMLFVWEQKQLPRSEWEKEGYVDDTEYAVPIFPHESDEERFIEANGFPFVLGQDEGSPFIVDGNGKRIGEGFDAIEQMQIVNNELYFAAADHGAGGWRFYNEKGEPLTEGYYDAVDQLTFVKGKPFFAACTSGVWQLVGPYGPIGKEYLGIKEITEGGHKNNYFIALAQKEGKKEQGWTVVSFLGLDPEGDYTAMQWNNEGSEKISWKRYKNITNLESYPGVGWTAVVQKEEGMDALINGREIFANDVEPMSRVDSLSCVGGMRLWSVSTKKNPSENYLISPDYSDFGAGDKLTHCPVEFEGDLLFSGMRTDDAGNERCLIYKREDRNDPLILPEKYCAISQGYKVGENVYFIVGLNSMGVMHLVDQNGKQVGIDENGKPVKGEHLQIQTPFDIGGKLYYWAYDSGASGADGRGERLYDRFGKPVSEAWASESGKVISVGGVPVFLSKQRGVLGYAVQWKSGGDAELKSSIAFQEMHSLEVIDEERFFVMGEKDGKLVKKVYSINEK